MPSRRDFVSACAVGALGALAGCSSVSPLGRGGGRATPELVDATGVHHNAGFGAATAVEDDVLVAGAAEAGTRSYEFSGSALVYEREDGEWTQTARFFPPGADLAGPHEEPTTLGFGSYVAVEDGTVVVGMVSAPVACTYERTGSGWARQQRIAPDVEAVADERHYPNDVDVESARCASLSFDGETLVLSARARLADVDRPTESVHVFERRDYDWREVAAFARGAPAEYDRYAHGTAVEDGTVVAGGLAGGETGADGRWTPIVETFDRTGDGWRRTATRRVDGAAWGTGRGKRDSVVLSGDTLAIGGIETASGAPSAVLVFERENDAWNRAGTLTPNFSDDEGRFGAGLALDDGTLLASAPGATVETDIGGSVSRYERDGDGWTLRRRYEERDGVRPGGIGSPALSTERVALGGIVRLDGLPDRQTVYVFPR